MDAKSITAENKGQAGTHNSPGDRNNQASPTTTSSDKKLKQTQERTGPPNNLVLRRARRAHHAITSWEHCCNDKCNDPRWEKVDAGYYPRQLGEKGKLSKHDSREHNRRAVRTRLGREGSEKLFRTWKLWTGLYRTSEANSIAPPTLL